MNASGIEVPPEPPPPADLNLRALWACLLAPSAIGILLLLLAITSGDANLALAALFTPAVLGLLLTVGFVNVIRPRFQGRSLVLLGIGYALGQILFPPLLLFGACLLMSPNFYS